MNVKTLLFIAFIGLTGSLNAQSKYIREANKKFNNENYCEAAGKCALAYTKIARKSRSAKNAKADMAWKTAESYRQIENYKEAHDWYEKAILLRYFEKEPTVYLHNAEVLMIMRDFKEASKNFELYKKLVPDDIRGENGMRSAELQLKDEYKETKTRHEVTNLSALNTEGFDMAPMLVDKRGKVMAFSSTRPGGTGTDKDPRTCEPYFDIYTSTVDAKGNFLAPKLLDAEDVNTEDNEGTICIDGRGKTMFFTRCPNAKKQNLGCEIWMAEARGTGWGKAEELTSLKPNDSVSVGHPCVSDDGKFLIFVSDFTGEGSVGGRDLWYSTYDKKNNTWTSPVNMGPEINTPGDELFPSLTINGDLIYSTTGLPGMGGLDLHRATKAGENKWENPVNMGAPLNSEYNDYALIEVEDELRMGYLTSERKDTKNPSMKPDLYKFVLPPPIFTLKVITSDISTKETIEGVKVVVTGSAPGDKWEGVTGKDGSIFWDKKPNADRYINENSSYTINISKQGYHQDKSGSKFTTVGLKYNQDFVVAMGLLPIKPIRLPEVRYPLAKWTLLVDSTINSKDSLLFVYDLLTEYPNMVLELSSHTDSRGGNIYNQALSDNRAKACYEYLVKEKGIDPRRIVPVGKGENEPRTVYLSGGKYYESLPKGMTGDAVKLTEAYINQFKKTDPKKFELLHQFNRRTEGKVLSMEFDPAAAPAANPAYLKFMIPLPKSNR